MVHPPIFMICLSKLVFFRIFIHVPMSICENPEFLPPSSVNKYNAIADMKRKRMMQDFIKAHYIELIEVSEGIKDLDTYKLELQIKTHTPINPKKP